VAGIRLLKRTGAALAAVVKPPPSPFQAHRAAAVQAAADDQAKWAAAVQAAVDGHEPDAAAVADLAAIAQRMGVGDVEQAFRADVAGLAALAAAESQLATMQAPRPGETVAGEIRQLEARLRQLKHELQRVAVVVQGRAVLRGEVEKLRARLPERLTKGGA
jgi:hypothetical protein